MKTALVCIAKNEDEYILEWINYHQKLGFDKIFIYENDWRCDLNSDIITKIPLDGKQQQVIAYNHFISQFYKKYDWAAFLDVDEFLVLKKHTNIRDFINEYSEFPAIGINWAIFGNNNHTSITDNYSVIQRFTKRQNGVDKHIKVIVKLDSHVRMIIHNTNSFCVDTNKNKIKGPFNHNGSDDVAQINHYFCKTKPEFMLKINRGKADALDYRSESEFETYNINEVTDLHALRFMYYELSHLAC